MLSLPDFREKQIVIVGMGEGKHLKFRNSNIIIENGEETLWQVSCHKAFAIFIIGEISLTSVLIRKALEYGISIVLMTPNLRSYAVIGAETEGNTLLRRKQYTPTDTLPSARQLVENKVTNQLRLLLKMRKKTAREHSAITALRNNLKNIPQTTEYTRLLGYEGEASKRFFQSYYADMEWKARMPRTKFDPANTLLDIGYTHLFNFVDALLRMYGFDTYYGFYHKEFYQRKSLTCDIVEPFRCIIDHKLRNANSLGQVKQKDFTTKNRRYDLKYAASNHYSKLFSEAIMERKEDIYNYVRSFYYRTMKSEEKMPQFLI